MANIDLNDVKEMIIASGAEMSEDVDIDVNTAFEAVGLDSLDMFGLCAEIDSRYNLAIPDEDIEQLICFADVIAYVTKKTHVNK